MKKYVKITILVELQCHHKRITNCNLINIRSQIKCYTLLTLIMNFLLKNRWMDKQCRKIFNNKNRTIYSMLIFNVNDLGIWTFRKQGGGDCMKRLFDSLKKHKKNIIDFERKKIFPSTKKN